MNKTLVAAAFAAAVASPAMAQQGPWLAQAPQASYVAPGAQTYMYAPGPYAQVGPGFQVQGAPSVATGAAVSVDGFIVGQDPDPNVRAELERNQDFYLGRTPN